MTITALLVNERKGPRLVAGPFLRTHPCGAVPMTIIECDGLLRERGFARRDEPLKSNFTHAPQGILEEITDNWRGRAARARGRV